VAQLDFIAHLDTTELAPGAFVVSVHGSLDARMASELRDVLIPLAAADESVILLDLLDAHGVDDDSLAVVARAAHLAARRGQNLAIVTRSRSLIDRVRRCGLGDVVTLRSTVEEVLRDGC
jgi:anti-anti-sigma factor